MYNSDSCLHLALDYCRPRKIPVHVMFFDEEVIDPDTEQHAADVAAMDGVVMHWLCVPVRHNLASELRPAWYTWDPREKDVWFRVPPKDAVLEIEGWSVEDGGIRECSSLYLQQAFVKQNPNARISVLAGVRAAESLNRRRAIMMAGSWMNERPNHLYVKPIYDWPTIDIWRFIRDRKIPYSAAYDRMARYGNQSVTQIRIAPWGNPHAVGKDGDKWAALYPEAWDRALKRLPELATQVMYGQTKAFKKTWDKPLGLTWQEYAFAILEKMEPDSQLFWKKQIANMLRRWAATHTQPFPETAVKMGNGEVEPICWARVCFMLQKNDRVGGSSRDLL